MWCRPIYNYSFTSEYQATLTFLAEHLWATFKIPVRPPINSCQHYYARVQSIHFKSMLYFQCDSFGWKIMGSDVYFIFLDHTFYLMHNLGWVLVSLNKLGLKLQHFFYFLKCYPLIFSQCCHNVAWFMFSYISC